MSLVSERAAAQIIHKCTCSLITTLIFAVNKAHPFLPAGPQCLHRRYKIFCGPCMILFVYISKRAGVPEQIIINRHTMRRHTNRVFIISAVLVLAGFSDMIVYHTGLSYIFIDLI